jgi:phosphoenolpyruvate-protein kinase (PTS system EI component)
MNKTRIFKGIPASLGIGIGNLFHIKLESEFIIKEIIEDTDVKKEIQRFKNALSLSIKELLKLKQG